MLNSSDNESRLTTSERLLSVAEKNEVKIDCFPMPTVRACELQIGNKSFLNIDPSLSPADALYALAHGLGHLVTGEMYNPYSVYDNVGKHERRADEWAIRKVFPRTKIKKAIRDGCVEPWQIAEEFGTSVEFATKAIKFYLSR